MDRGAWQVPSMGSQELDAAEHLNNSSSAHTASSLVRVQPVPTCKSGAHSSPRGEHGSILSPLTCRAEMLSCSYQLCLWHFFLEYSQTCL